MRNELRRTRPFSETPTNGFDLTKPFVIIINPCNPWLIFLVSRGQRLIEVLPDRTRRSARSSVARFERVKRTQATRLREVPHQISTRSPTHSDRSSDCADRR